MTKIPCPKCGNLAYWAESGITEAKCPTCGKYVRAVLKGDEIIETTIVPPRKKTA